MADHSSAGARLRALWRRLSPLPGGRWLFSRVLGWMIPYTGTLGATVLELDTGRCRVRMQERRALRNHLRSVHAVALANLGELVSGLALVGSLPQTVRGIVTGIDVRFHKKARGVLEAEATCTVPEVDGSVEHTVEASVRDEAGDLVATVTARWLLGPIGGES